MPGVDRGQFGVLQKLKRLSTVSEWYMHLVTCNMVRFTVGWLQPRLKGCIPRG